MWVGGRHERFRDAASTVTTRFRTTGTVMKSVMEYPGIRAVVLAIWLCAAISPDCRPHNAIIIIDLGCSPGRSRSQMSVRRNAKYM